MGLKQPTGHHMKEKHRWMKWRKEWAIVTVTGWCSDHFWSTNRTSLLSSLYSSVYYVSTSCSLYVYFLIACNILIPQWCHFLNLLLLIIHLSIHLHLPLVLVLVSHRLTSPLSTPNWRQNQCICIPSILRSLDMRLTGYFIISTNWIVSKVRRITKSPKIFE